MSRAHILFCLAALLALTACEGDTKQSAYRNEKDEYGDAKAGSVFGSSGLDLFGLNKKPGDTASGGGIGVNSFLWRASLDTLAFMPLASADPFGGVIITDWYSPPETPDERLKITIFILDRQLRSDGLRAAIFRQHREHGTEWAASAVETATQTELENTILTRARQLRVNTAAAQ